MQDATGQTHEAGRDEKLTIITHRPHGRELPWLRFLLGEWAGEVIEDPDRKLVLPNSLVVSQRPDRLRSRVLARIRRLGSVGLFHVGDETYRARLDAYGSFAFVWRTYYHTALEGLKVQQFPVGPQGLDPISPTPLPAALRPPGERLYTWSFAGMPSTSRDVMLDALTAVDGGTNSGEVHDEADLELLADSVFAPCAMDTVHLETPRIYAALEMGAIPIVERRRWLDYFGELFGTDHPLPSVRHWIEAPELIRRLSADQQALTELQKRVVAWWTTLKARLAETAQAEVAQCVVGMRTPDVFGPLDKPSPRWRNRIEMLRQQDMAGLRERFRSRATPRT